ncbi:MAG: hypothetical protein JXB47_15050 [Anaerolineae bacterium]|nr:hypothetical protein [Anaerolineae bacterium]
MRRYLLLIVLLLLAACQPSGPTAAELMPSIPGYNVVEGQDLTDAISKLAGGAALLEGNLPAVGAVTVIDGIMDCYQEAGAVSGRIFTKADYALDSGVIVIVDRNRLTNPQTFLDCVRPQGPEMSAASAIQPCGSAYTLRRDDNEYYILYAGTQPEVCKAFCSALEGCTQ